MRCPACGSSSTAITQRHSVEAAATHLIPPLRDPARHGELQRELTQLWGARGVAIRACSTCDFGFADPFVAGTPEIYNLISAGESSYPSARFEFDAAIAELRLSQRPLRLLEIGAGRGAFINLARAAGLVAKSVTAEFDDAALDSLAAIPGNVPVKGGLQEVLAGEPEPFDAICMFQVLEHMDRLPSVFDALMQLTAPGAPVFISVPNPARTETQERLIGFWDMPPNHIGRWSRCALERAATGLDVVDQAFEPVKPLREAWSLSKYRWEARAYAPHSLGARVNGIADRRIRGVLKRTLGIWDFLLLAPHARRLPPQTQLFRLVRSRA